MTSTLSLNRQRGARRRGSGRGALTLIVMEAVLAVGALGGAITLIVDGDRLGAATADLPWQSPVLAGVALAAVNVLLPGVVIAGALRQASWAPIGHVAVGLALVGWIVVQVAFIGLTSWLQPILAVYGVAVTLLALRDLRRHRQRAG